MKIIKEIEENSITFSITSGDPAVGEITMYAMMILDKLNDNLYSFSKIIDHTKNPTYFRTFMHICFSEEYDIVISKPKLIDLLKVDKYEFDIKGIVNYELTDEFKIEKLFESFTMLKLVPQDKPPFDSYYLPKYA